MAGHRKLPASGSSRKTRLGTFKWEGPHLKWCCDSSRLGKGLDLMIDDYEVTEQALKKLERIYLCSRFYLKLALLRARPALRENRAGAPDMRFFGIGLSSDPLPGFTLDFRYPDTIWPGGELSVQFYFGIPLAVEQGG